MKDKKELLFWILFPIISAIITLVVVFYFDLANGPLICFIIELIALAIAIAFRIILRRMKPMLRVIPGLSFLLVTIILLPFTHPYYQVKPAVDFRKPEKTEVLSLLNGDVQGVYSKDKKVEIYAGIPYAKAPVGDLRWKEPQDVESWSGVRDCSNFAPRAMQNDTNAIISTLVDMYSSKGWYPDYTMSPLQNMSEDCLYLNIWKPHVESTNLPIIVYIHGGSLTSGSSAFDEYNGESMAKEGVITITIAYRLGIFGYFASEELQNESPNHTTGNYGLLDQIKALEWVKNNATSFNGDPNNITIAGESAGSSSVSALCTSPRAAGLFKKAIGESSSLVVKKAPHTYREFSKALETDKQLYKEFKANNIEDLRKIPAKKLVKTKFAPSQMTLDGYALEKDPYDVYAEHNSNEDILLNGFNVKESDAFVVPTFLFNPTNKKNIRERLANYFNEDIANKLMDVYKDKIEEDAFAAFNDIISVYWFMQPHQSWSKMAIESGKTVYRYQFTKDNKFHGNYHSGELPYVFNNLHKDKHKYRYNQSDYDLADKMVKYWVEFAKTGNPNYEGAPQSWPEYNLSDYKLMEFGDHIGLIDDPYLNLYPIIDEYIESLLH